jgi:hypothetical protein
MFDYIQELLQAILLGFAPSRRANYGWYMAVSLILMLACSTCSLIVESVMVAKR